MKSEIQHSPEEIWDVLCQELKTARVKDSEIPLFSGGMMNREKLTDWEISQDAINEIRKRMKAFLAQQGLG
jgi:hypothetical protein